MTFIYVVIKSIDGNSRFLWKISASNPSGRAVRLQPLRDQMTRQWPRPVRRFCSFREASDHKNHREVHKDGGPHIKFRSHVPLVRKSRSFYGKSHVDMSNWDDIQALSAGYCNWKSRSQNGQVGLGNMSVTARWTSENIGVLTNYQTNPVSIPMALGSIMFNPLKSPLLLLKSI